MFEGLRGWAVRGDAREPGSTGISTETMSPKGMKAEWTMGSVTESARPPGSRGGIEGEEMRRGEGKGGDKVTRRRSGDGEERTDSEAHRLPKVITRMVGGCMKEREREKERKREREKEKQMTGDNRRPDDSPTYSVFVALFCIAGVDERDEGGGDGVRQQVTPLVHKEKEGDGGHED